MEQLRSCAMRHINQFRWNFILERKNFSIYVELTKLPYFIGYRTNLEFIFMYTGYILYILISQVNIYLQSTFKTTIVDESAAKHWNTKLNKQIQ